MAEPSNAKPTQKEYYDAVARLETAREVAIDERKAAEVSGDVRAGERSLEKLRLAVAEFRGMRSKLSATDLFVIEYGVTVVGPSRVSLVIPADVAPSDLLVRSQEVSQEAFGRPAFRDDILTVWSSSRLATSSEAYSRRLDIDGCVDGTQGKSINQQDAILRKRGLELPNLLELGLAHVSYLFATGEDLFQGKKVRADSLALFVGPSGLCVDSPAMQGDLSRLAASARLSKSLEESDT
jgi:hypothetical protein